MQSGAVSASRDLQAMDHEVHQLAERQSHLEEEELVLLEEQEPLDTRLGEDQAGRGCPGRRGRAADVAIAEAEAEIEAAIAAETAVRDRLAPGLPCRAGRAVRAAAVPPRGGGCSPSGGGPVRRLSPDPAVRGDRADPSTSRPRSSPPARSATASWCTERRGLIPKGGPMLILVRHGESTGNADGLLLGRIDAPLTERGLAQARDAWVRWWSGATRVISSPLQRARRYGRGPGHRPSRRDRRPVDRGGLRGVRRTSARRRSPTRCGPGGGSDPDFRPPGGETLREAGDRVRSACEELFAVDGEGARGTGAVVVVSHVSPIKAAAAGHSGSGTRGRGASTWPPRR